MMWMARCVEKIHMLRGMLAWKERDMAMFRMYFFPLSMTPFCCGVSIQVFFVKYTFRFEKRMHGKFRIIIYSETFQSVVKLIFNVGNKVNDVCFSFILRF